MTAAEAAKELVALSENDDSLTYAKTVACGMGAALLEREAAAEGAEPLEFGCDTTGRVTFTAQSGSGYPAGVLAARLRATANGLESRRADCSECVGGSPNACGARCACECHHAKGGRR
jgi:hypothetical protein